MNDVKKQVRAIFALFVLVAFAFVVVAGMLAAAVGSGFAWVTGGF